MPRKPPKPEPVASKLPEQERTVMVAFPMTLTMHTALKVRAAQERTTVRGMVMQGLRALGLEIPDEDLSDRRPGRVGRPRGS